MCNGRLVVVIPAWRHRGQMEMKRMKELPLAGAAERSGQALCGGEEKRFCMAFLNVQHDPR